MSTAAQPYGRLVNSTETPAIRIDHVSKRFKSRQGSITAVDDISLSIPSGQFFTIVGPSGCGKTTLLRMLAGLEEPTEGTIELQHGGGDGPVNSMIFQEASIFPWMTVWDNAAFGLRMRHAPRAEVKERVGHYLDKTGLSRFKTAYPHQLSGGMKQRVSIARAFANDPAIFLMDEPFSALDEQNKAVLQQELLRIWDEDRKTVVFITHSVDEAITMGDRVMIMTARPGRLKSMIEIPFPRPRSVLELRAVPEYGHLVRKIWDGLQGEVREALGAEANGGEGK
ncbi:ABC transporter ATP-binding protein [Pseudarthrobacter sulfonivorans]|uniref:ABC transporter ATP-binding protein n=1 Tax=Pseudarthrobacter sulfonivorans TaxID=121292 RepID=UPI001CC29D5F|nr:ABC transporter ATP-binding protein [Pseudarthrobacter sulfonivorans]